MSIEVILIEAESEEALHVEPYTVGTRAGKILAITTPAKAHGVFQCFTFDAEETITLAEPEADGSVELTDVIITFEKKQLATVTVQFNDGTNQEPIFKIFLNDAPINMSVNFNGKFQGWQSAYVEGIVAGAAADGTITVGFLKRSKAGSDSYTKWGAKR